MFLEFWRVDQHVGAEVFDQRCKLERWQTVIQGRVHPAVTHGGVQRVQMNRMVGRENANAITGFDTKLEHAGGEGFNVLIELRVTDPVAAPEHGGTVWLEASAEGDVIGVVHCVLSPQRNPIAFQT